MCWITKNVTNRLIAENDIPVFKIGRVSGDNAVAPYFFNNGMGYRENTTYSADCVIKTRPCVHGSGMRRTIDKGIHSYLPRNIRLKPDYIATFGVIVPTVRVFTVKTTATSPDVLRDGQKYLITIAVVMLCVIPKGATYYINEVGEVVSDRIRVVRMIRQPFTTTKGKLTSERSVDKVNHIIDNWENNFKNFCECGQ